MSRRGGGGGGALALWLLFIGEVGTGYVARGQRRVVPVCAYIKYVRTYVHTYLCTYVYMLQVWEWEVSWLSSVFIRMYVCLAGTL